MHRAIVLFARAPAAEAAAKHLRIDAAAPVFRSAITAWLRAADRLGATAVIACNPPDRAALARIEPDVPRTWIDQRGAHFGERLAAAADDAFARGFDAILIAGIDAPPPAGPALLRAFDAIARGVAVVEPSPDGGINFFGLHQPARALFVSIAPRERNLLARCRAYFPQLLVLPAIQDLDAFEPTPVALAAPRLCTDRPRPATSDRAPPAA